MIAVALKNIEKYYGANKVLHDVTFEVQEGEKVALVGRNGSGKTTLLRIIGGESYEGGQLTLRRRIIIGYLEQHSGQFPGLCGQDVLIHGNKELLELKLLLHELERSMATEADPDRLEVLLSRYGRAMERYDTVGGYSQEARINAVVQGLRISQATLESPFDTLSGGEKTKLLFAQMLISEPELLLLDEPTNHLDMDALEWLEGFIRSYKGTVILVSHDRQFLDQSIGRIIELEDGECSSYNGNYTYYLQEKERRLLVEFENYQDQQKKIRSMEAAIKRLRDWGLRGDNEKFFRKAESIQKAIDRMEKIKRPILERRSIELSFDMNERSGKDVVLCEDLGLSFGDRLLFEKSSFHLRFREAVGLIGANGTGKSSFFRLILQELEPSQGTLKLGAAVKVGYLPQIVHFPHGDRTILEEFRHGHPSSEGVARGILARFLFYKDSVFKTVQSLSGGEKTRLRLAQLMHEDVNLLLLDEPTNHLDLETRETLENALLDFDGTILFISHDRYFVNKLASRLYRFQDHRIQESWRRED